MSGDLFFSWVMAGFLAGLAVLMFLLYRRNSEWVLRMMCALFGAFSAVFALLVAVVTAAEGPIAWAMEDGLILVGATVVLIVIILLVWRSKGPRYRDDEAGRAARARDEARPERKRSCFVDLLGCLVVGIVLVVGFVVLVAFGSGLANN